MAEREISLPRLSIVGIVCVSLFASLFVRLWYLQVVDQKQYQVTASAFHQRIEHVEGARGRILDRNGKVLVDNRVVLVVGINRQDLNHVTSEDRLTEFDRLAATMTEFGLPTKAPAIEAKYEDKRYSPFEMVPLATIDSSRDDLELFLGEHHDGFPGVEVRHKTVRTYPYGSVAAHLLGYVGELNETELQRKQAEEGKPGQSTNIKGEVAKPYVAGDEIGKAGVEATYEAPLRGVPADTTIQVDARGDYLRTLKQSDTRQGDDVWLTIDVDLQAYAEQLLAQKLESMRGTIDKGTGKERKAPQGSVVITNPQTGEILAMASYPTYNPADLVNGIDSVTWSQLNDKSAGQPLFNWALQGAYAPGSTFKLFTATAAGDTGFLKPGQTYNDTGSYKVSNCKGNRCTFTNDGGNRYGVVDVTKALTVSSDVFFYWVGDQLWQQRGTFGEQSIQDVASQYGLGSRSGVKLPGEGSGNLPTPAVRKKLHEDKPAAFPNGNWYAGDNVNTAIGQGDVLVTPLQLANAYGTFANGGKRLIPQIVLKVTRPKDVGYSPSDPANATVQSFNTPQVAGTVTYKDDSYSRIYAGLQGVVEAGNGTAHEPFTKDRPAFTVAGKTGTAQVANKASTSVFVGFAPADGPGTPAQYAIDVVIPEAGHGADFAAPLVFAILNPLSRNAIPPAATVPVQPVTAPPAVTPPAGSTSTTGSTAGPTTTTVKK